MHNEIRSTRKKQQAPLTTPLLRLIGVIALIFLFSAGCGPSSGTTPTPVSSSPTVVAQQSTPTATLALSTATPLPSPTSTPVSTATPLPLLSPTVAGDGHSPWYSLMSPDDRQADHWLVPWYVGKAVISNLQDDWAFIIERQDDYLKNGATKPLDTKEFNHYATGIFLTGAISDTLTDAKNNKVTFATSDSKDYTFENCDNREGTSCNAMFIVEKQQLHSIDLSSGIPYKVKNIRTPFTGEYVITMKYFDDEKWWKIDHFVIYSSGK